MKPKYSVGEVVILQSIYFPELNGEYSIKDAQFQEGRTWDGSDYKGFVYYLDIHPKFKAPGFWIESALRKKHQPGELSFQELMSSFNIKEKA